MVPVDVLRSAIDQLEAWHAPRLSTIGWVNWRKGYQVKLLWKSNPTFICYLDFGTNSAAREAVMKRAFERFAPAGTKPKKEIGHGWTRLDYSLRTDDFVSVQDLAEIADELGFQYTILYVQNTSGARPLFETLGIPLVPGESGKEWTGSEFIGYTTPRGQNL
jgi:hypothetical protein